MTTTTSILIVGVGGQGTLLTSRILGHLLSSRGFDVKISEIHGMAQRGGSVVTHVRFGDRVHSPIIEPGGADQILSFEFLETLRWIHYLAPEGSAILNTQKIAPLPVITGETSYPEDLVQRLRQACNHLYMLDAASIAARIGNVKTVNVVLLGILSRLLPFERESWTDAVSEVVPARFREMNVRAFEIGRIVVCDS